MSSLTDSSRFPRVGIMRGVVPSTRTVMPDARRHMPQDVVDTPSLETLRQQATDEGWQAGYAEGLAAAQAQADADRDEMNQRYTMAMDAILDAATDLRQRQVVGLAEVADQTALLALRIAEIVLAREVSTATNPGRDAIARAMGLVSEEGTIRIRLNADDLAVIGDVSDLFPSRDVELVRDPGVATGGCIITVGATRIDAQIATALDRVAEVLR